MVYGMTEYEQKKVWRGYPLDQDGQRWCSICETWKPVDEFYFDTRRPGARYRRCHPCQIKAAHDAMTKAGRYSNRAALTQAEYDERLKAQDGKCAICGSTEPGKGKSRFAADHDHRCCPSVKEKKSCGKCLRKLLCHYCNAGLGDFRDDPELLRKAALYLEEYRDEAELPGIT